MVKKVLLIGKDLSKNMCIREADLQKVNHIMDHIKNNGSTTSLGR